MSYIKIENISKKYAGSEKFCLEDLNMSIEKGEIIALLGASGCGKTTLLKIIAGLERQNTGMVHIDGEDMGERLAEKRPIAMVFQKALLFPHMTVEKNINFAPRVNKTMEKDELKKRTMEMVKLVHIEGLEHRKPSELSGGQEQRVSLARALITNPKVLLLDEPLSALDANLKTVMVSMIREINRKLDTTMIYVTHDQAEAAAVADKIALMHEGRIVQFDSPEMFYQKPANRYSAEFFGWQNFVPVTRNGKDIIACIRPEAFTNIGSGKYKGIIRDMIVQGVDARCSISCNDQKLTALIRNDSNLKINDEILFDIDESMIWYVNK